MALKFGFKSHSNGNNGGNDLALYRSGEAFSSINTPLSMNQAVFYGNYTGDPKSAVLPSSGLEAHQPVVDRLRARQIQLSEANIALSNSVSKGTIPSYLRFQLQVGLLHGDLKELLERVVYLDNPSDLNTTFNDIKKQRPGTAVVPYMLTPHLVETAKSLGVEIGNDIKLEALENLIRLSDKGTYRDVLKALNLWQEAYPRITIRYNSPRIFGEKREAVRLQRDRLEKISECIEYTRKYNYGFDIPQEYRKIAGIEPLRRVLFCQPTQGAGGFGNFVIYENRNGELFIDRHQLENPSNIYNKHRFIKISAYSLHELSRVFLIAMNRYKIDFECAPCLKVLDIGSAGIVINRQGIAVMAGRGNGANEAGQFQFWSANLENKFSTKHILSQYDHALKLGRYLHARGVESTQGVPFGVDFMLFETPEGQVRHASPELNARREATGNLIGMIWQHKDLARRFILNQISLLAQDHVQISQSNMDRIGNSTYELACLLSANGLPILSRTDDGQFNKSDYGIVFITPPYSIPEMQCHEVSLGIIGNNSADVINWKNKALAILAG